MTICTKFRYTWPSGFSQKCKKFTDGRRATSDQKARLNLWFRWVKKKNNAIGYKIYRDIHCQMLVCDTNGRGFTWCTRLGDSWDLWERRTPMVHLILSTYSFWKTLYFLKLCLARHFITELLCCYMWGNSHDRTLQSNIFFLIILILSYQSFFNFELNIQKYINVLLLSFVTVLKFI